jgi:hypothetical protein
MPTDLLTENDVAGDWLSSEVDTLDVQVLSSEAVELDDVATFVVAFATDEDGEQFALAFEVGLNEPDDQDRRLRLDGYSVVDHHGRCVYEAVGRWSADPDQSMILFELTAEAVEVLEIPTQIRLRLRVDRGTFDRLVQGLERVFTGFMDTSRQPVRMPG